MIAAAGSGRRLGAGGPKAFVELAGRPMIEWSLLALGRAAAVGSVVIAAPPGGEGAAERAAERAAPDLGAVVLAGGESRAESVELALGRVETELVAVHDAARPLAGPAVFDRVLARLDASPQAAAVVAAAPIADTVKRAGGDGVVAETLERGELWAAQTPQAFRVAALRAAHESARGRERLESATDEARLIEWDGGTVLLEPASSPNPKVTDSADLALAATLLRDRSG